MNNSPLRQKTSAFAPYLSAIGIWALAFGCSVGQGAFVMPGNTFLPIAGPIGTVIGIVIGGLVMLIIAANYHFLMNRFPGSGGTYSFIKNNFGYDHGFLCGWFLLLTYIAILWANATALPVIARTLLGSTFRFGFHYELAGYHIYFGEILLAVLAMTVAAVICMKRKLSAGVQAGMCIALLVGVIVCFVAAVVSRDDASPLFRPAYAEEKPIRGIFTIFALAPWAYAGFESVSHSAGEATFPLKKTFRIFCFAIGLGAVAYGLLALLASVSVPEGLSDWKEYVASLGNYSGTTSVPTFYAAEKALGKWGSLILGTAALCGIFTGLIGNFIALSRLIVSMSDDNLLPQWIGKVDENHVPRRAILAILVVSLVLPFFGRTAISWIVDVTTVGATIAFAFTSAAAWKTARQERSALNLAFGVAGLAISLFFALAFLVPNLISVKTLATESYLILAAWCLLGIVMMMQLLLRDKERRLGRSSVALVVMLGVIIFTSTVWMRQTTDNAVEQAVVPIQSYYSEQLAKAGVGTVTDAAKPAYTYLHQIMDQVYRSLDTATTIQIALISVTLVFVFSIYTLIQKREKEVEIEKVLAEESSRAKTSFLSNMSHEIRTPMNAIIGLDNIALRDPTLSPKTREHLEKIASSAKHLRGLIDDILDMSRIESGRMILKNEVFSIHDVIGQVSGIINSQCLDKGLQYVCKVDPAIQTCFYGDDLKLKQVLINILGNAVKFTEAPGTVSLTVECIGENEESKQMRFIIQDTGIGMDRAFIPKIFESFSQEDASNTNRYGGSGLGMAITKNYVEMMGGNIHVDSEKGVGSVFTVTVALKASDKPDLVMQTLVSDAASEQTPDGAEQADAEKEAENMLAGRRVLIAEDVDTNAEILADLLDLEEIESERAINGQVAVEMFAASSAGYYDAILMDVRMPVMDGLTATRTIRAMERVDAKRIPIIAMTANVFEEDVRMTREAGMNAHLAKPIEPDRMYATISEQIASYRSAPPPVILSGAHPRLSS